jgi:hypothetical protein
VDGYQAEIVSVLDGQVVENRLWFFDRFGAATSTEQQQLSDGVAAWYVGNVLPLLSSDLDCQIVKVSSWATNPPPTVAFTGISLPGGDASPSHSANVAVSVPFDWVTEAARLKRNKNYIPGIPKSAVDLNTVSSTFVDGIWDAYVALVDLPGTWSTGNIWRWVTVSLFENNALRSEAFFKRSLGPSSKDRIHLGQRRKRLAP